MFMHMQIGRQPNQSVFLFSHPCRKLCVKKYIPNLPHVLEPEPVGVDADEAPDGEDEDPKDVEAQHLRGPPFHSFRYI